MALNNKKISTRFLLQSLYSIAVIISVLAVIVISSVYKREAHRGSDYVVQMQLHTADMMYSIEGVLANQKHNSYFVESFADQAIAKSKETSQNVIDDLEQLLKVNIVRRSQENIAKVDSLITATKYWDTKYEQMVYTLKTLGNANGGMKEPVCKASESLRKSLLQDNFPDAVVDELLNVQKEFIEEGTLQVYGSFMDLCGRITHNMELCSEETKNNCSTVIDHLEKTKATAIRLYKDGENAGYIEELSVAAIEIQQKVDGLKENLTLAIDDYYIMWNRIFIGLIVVFLITFIIVRGRFMRSVNNNIKKILEKSESMAQGEFNPADSYNGRLEFQEINANYLEICNYVTERDNFLTDLLNFNYKTRIRELSESDKLSNTLNNLRDRLLKEQEEQENQNKTVEIRRYINEGLTLFAEIMRTNSNDLEALGDELTKNLVKYLEAAQGGVFLTDEDDEKKLNLIATFAFDRKRFLQKELRVGEGLVGTCAVEKRTINLTEIPHGYVSIKSGLGDTPPNNVLIVPVMNNSSMVGVIELTSLNIFTEHQVELAEQIASSLASTIITVRNNTKTAQLLEKSQQQAAEMLEQEEEMRQNMEELQATQEESARREEEMHGLLKAVDSGFYQIEYNTEGLIENVNSKLYDFLDQSPDMVIGRKHVEVFSEKSVITDEVLSYVVETKRSKKIKETLPLGSKSINYLHTLSPITTNSGVVVKILNLITIEEEN